MNGESWNGSPATCLYTTGGSVGGCSTKIDMKKYEGCSMEDYVVKALELLSAAISPAALQELHEQLCEEQRPDEYSHVCLRLFSIVEQLDELTSLVMLGTVEDSEE